MTELAIYNGFNSKQRMAKYKEMQKRGLDRLAIGPCRLCNVSTKDFNAVGLKPHFEFHDEDYSDSPEYCWDEPAAYVLCKYCHVYQVHARFRFPVRWAGYLDHVRRGGYSIDLKVPSIKAEFDAHCALLKSGKLGALAALRPYQQIVGEEWFSRLTCDQN